MNVEYYFLAFKKTFCFHKEQVATSIMKVFKGEGGKKTLVIGIFMLDKPFLMIIPLPTLKMINAGIVLVASTLITIRKY